MVENLSDGIEKLKINKYLAVDKKNREENNKNDDKKDGRLMEGGQRMEEIRSEKDRSNNIRKLALILYAEAQREEGYGRVMYSIGPEIEPAEIQREKQILFGKACSIEGKQEKVGQVHSNIEKIEDKNNGSRQKEKGINGDKLNKRFEDEDDLVRKEIPKLRKKLNKNKEMRKQRVIGHVQERDEIIDVEIRRQEMNHQKKIIMIINKNYQ